MKAYLEFDLADTDEAQEHRTMISAQDMACAIWDTIHTRTDAFPTTLWRAVVKGEHDMGEDADEVLQTVLAHLWECYEDVHKLVFEDRG